MALISNIAGFGVGSINDVTTMKCDETGCTDVGGYDNSGGGATYQPVSGSGVTPDFPITEYPIEAFATSNDTPAPSPVTPANVVTIGPVTPESGDKPVKDMGTVMLLIAMGIMLAKGESKSILRPALYLGAAGYLYYHLKK